MVNSTSRVLFFGLFCFGVAAIDPGSSLWAATTFVAPAPSEPDGPLPATAPELEKLRREHDATFQALRSARVEAREVGRPAMTGGLPFFLAGDPVINLDSGLGYSSLQAAINAATPGDTLQVVTDLDEGPVTVDRNLFIEGATGSEVIRATQDTGTSGDARGWFLVNSGVALVVRDLTFDGNGFQIFQAFRHRGFGLFERTGFRDIQYQPSGPLYAGTAIVAFGDRVDVQSSTFEQIGRVGVLLFGSSVAGAIYGGNSYVGKGDGDFLDYGVEVNAGASAWVLDSSFVDCRGVSIDGFSSAGVLATTASGPNTTVVVDGNQLLRNTFGLRAGANEGDTTTAAASFNRLVDNDFGITAGSDIPTQAENNWWGCNDGPGTTDCDAASTADNGTVDADPWLTLELEVFPWVKPNDYRPLTGLLTMNSDGANTTGLGTLADGTPGTFGSGILGTVAPPQDLSFAGRLSAFFLAASAEGTETVTLTVDQQTVQQTIVVEDGLFCDGFESGDSSAWTSTNP